ncbi:hypothetical protein CDAR_305311 [Caerostris darwini]|uniref:Uncharacterized protein n=1 Tax=Caerostris darwini TaxID=1538125 RepID=A0AAV4MCH4_9ARAC|nr:hypothetical protein CDAR_305311 [Caerostris darwini]
MAPLSFNCTCDYYRWIRELRNDLCTAKLKFKHFILRSTNVEEIYDGIDKLFHDEMNSVYPLYENVAETVKQEFYNNLKTFKCGIDKHIRSMRTVIARSRREFEVILVFLNDEELSLKYANILGNIVKNFDRYVWLFVTYDLHHPSTPLYYQSTPST